MSTLLGRLTGFALAIACFFFSCYSYRGYGVFLWKNENLPFGPGELLNITSIFKVDNYYEVEYNGTLLEVPIWQVEFFETREEAVRFRQAFEPYFNTYGFTLKYDGLPVRKEPKNTAPMVYRLKAGKIAKVLARDEKPTQIGGLESYWYRLLTEEGVQGYVFGYYLNLIEDSKSLDKKIDELTNKDPALDAFLNNIWRPLELKEMLEKNQLDLNYLKRNYGLIPNSKEKKITLITPSQTKEYRYTEIRKSRGDTYEVVGTDLTIQIIGSRKIVASYFLDGNYVLQEFILLDKDLDELARFEEDRWKNQFYQFLNRGKSLHSDIYGTLELKDDFRFKWSDFEEIAIIIPYGTRGAGSLSFTYKLGPLLSGNFDGVITFYFDEAPEYPLVFVYRFYEGGVQLYHITADNLAGTEVKRLGSNPLILNFNFN